MANADAARLGHELFWQYWSNSQYLLNLLLWISTVTGYKLACVMGMTRI